ncbi:Hypothetical protein, putative [Bodo saltans]|uniref:Uncharacterized protein n=1 Tax=Bodo saltans TaxID=75058 RepID=A0A0S4IZI9_BODSA|nr:Hypothetical protein, putative [Bodo saltans]|eukprot:CUG67720.1 Hypothetical protein, putative [Bodo saltans]
MLRLTSRWLARPKGPLGQRPGGSFEKTMPYRSETAMINLHQRGGFNANMRNRFRTPQKANKFRAVPRDLGEVPRNYALKSLFLQQPIRLLDLWETLKQRDDIPFDSMKHLRNVLKISGKMKWVYAEKNQTNNMWYYYIHQSRMAEVQDMIRQESILDKERDAHAAVQRTQEAKALASDRSVALDASIMALQNMLVQNVATIAEFDPEYTRSLPYVTESGAVNVAWNLPARSRESEENANAI